MIKRHDVNPRKLAKGLVRRLAAVLAALSPEDLRWHLTKKLRP